MEPSQKIKRNILPWVIVGVLIVFMALEAVTYYRAGSLNPLKINSQKTIEPEEVKVNPETIPVADEEKNETVTAPKRVVDAGINWIEPKKLANQELFKKTAQEDYLVDETEYYKIANLSAGGELILATLPPNSPAPALAIRFLKDTAGKYYYLAGASDEEISGLPTSIIMILADKVSQEYSTKYGQLVAPDILITDKGYKLSLVDNRPRFFSELEKPIKLDDSMYGPIYKTTMQPEGVSLFTVTSLYLKHGDSTISGYSIASNDFTDHYPQFNLLNGQKNTISYYPIEGSGCGSYGSASIILDTTNITNRIEAYGKTASGDSIYRIKDPADKLYDSAYSIYLKYNQPEKAITRAAYAAQKPVIIWQDNIGDYEAFVKEGLQVEEGCGKPVVYLYPTKTTDVSVTVGAKITVSDPLYQNGWKATADPSGRLIVNGKKYPYLFWEGTGYGPYPQIDFGTVVKQSELKSTLLSQMTKLGLNEKERSDFMEFWWERMPKNPYVRLSWLGTVEMERLAPLNITPKPDTKIRIFLDFAGLNKPMALKSQKLSSPARKGFTVVEWGGLLRNIRY